MPDFGIYAGDTNKTIYVRLRDSSTGLAKTGLVWNSAGAVCSFTLPLAARAAITLATQTVTGAHSDGGFVEIDATNCKGLYRLDLTDAAIASGDFTVISIEFDGIIEESVEVALHTRKVNAIEISGTTQTANDVGQDVNDILTDTGTTLPGLLPSALVGGRMDADVGAKTGNVALSTQEKLDVNTEADTALTDYGALTDKAGFALSTAGILAIWHQLNSAIVTAGSMGKLLKDEITSVRMAVLTDWIDAGRLDAILDIIAADTTTDIPALIATAQADLNIITGASGVNLLTATQASIDAIEADTNELQGDDVPGLIAALNDITVANILAGTITEISAVPGASPTLLQAISLLYIQLRNKVDVDKTALTKELHLDAGTVLGTKGLSDDGTTYSEGKMA